MRADKLSMAAGSVKRFVGLAAHHRLHTARGRVGNVYSVGNDPYRIFRETVLPDTTGEPVIMVIGFRLKLIRSVPVLHAIFQRVCLLTTPFWSGLPGFRTKLWMVDPATGNYLGIYDWRGKKAAQAYLNFLLPILNFFSVGGSVWARQIHGDTLETYLKSREVDNTEGLALSAST